MNNVWTDFEVEFIKNNADNLTDEEGAIQLSSLVNRKITRDAWRKKRQKLGFKKKPGRGICELDAIKTVPGLNGDIRYDPRSWTGIRLPNVMCYGRPAYVNPDIWPTGTAHLPQEEVQRLVARSND